MTGLINEMISTAHASLKNAYAPYSNYSVSSCICTDKDNLYTGVNVENASYGLTICAEGSAICQMVSAGETKIKSIVILASTNELCSPCGACRQRIYGFADKTTLVHLCSANAIIKTLSIEDLLPQAFDFTP